MNWQPNASLWQQKYQETGYLVVENVIEASELQAMRAALDRIERDVTGDKLAPHLRRWVSTERQRTARQKSGQVESDALSNIMELPLFDPIFQTLIINPRVLDVLEALFETPEFAFHNLKCICKMAGNQAPFVWHRDLPYLQHTSPNLLTCMICVDDMTLQNGATVVCPGSHRVAHQSVTDADRDIAENELPAERVTVECSAGSAVLFHVNIVHGGGPNHSDAPRRNVIGIWSGPGAYPTTPMRYAFQGVMPRSLDPMRHQQIHMSFGSWLS